MSLINKIGFWGSVASIVGLAIVLIPSQSTDKTNNNAVTTTTSGRDNTTAIVNNTGNVNINHLEKDNVNKNNKQLSLLDDVTIGSNKEYIESILGAGKKGKVALGVGKKERSYTYFSGDFVIEIIYYDNIVKSLKLIPRNETFSKTINISRFKNGSFSGSELFLGDATIGSLVKALDGNAEEIDANTAGAGNMNCVNYAQYTYKIKPHAMAYYQKVTIGYMAPLCPDDNTEINYYIVYPEHENLLYEGVNEPNASKLMQLKLNFIEIEETTEL